MLKCDLRALLSENNVSKYSLVVACAKRAREISDNAVENKIEIIDLYPEISPDSDAMSNDGIHPSAKGAGIMAKKIAEVLRKAKAMR